MVGPAGFHVDSPEGERWELALELLAQGEVIICRRVRLTLEADALRASAELTWPTQVTDSHVREDLGRAQAVVGELLRSDESFRTLVGDSTIEYEAIDDPGMGAVLIAALKDGGIEWAPGFGPSTAT